MTFSSVAEKSGLCREIILTGRNKVAVAVWIVDCKTVRIFAYSSTREQSNKRSGTSLKTERETGETPHTSYTCVRLARFAHVRLLPHALQISLLILRKKNRLFCSLCGSRVGRYGRLDCSYFRASKHQIVRREQTAIWPLYAFRFGDNKNIPNT